jgi:hypothetical protein
VKVDEIVVRASEEAGLDDFGSDSYREGLEILVGSVAAEAVPKPQIKERVYSQYKSFLINRLRIVDYAKRNPAVVSEKIERPLFIMGMPRSGTTVLSYLLDQDPNRRSLLLWEALDSVPPPTSTTLRTDARCLALLRQQEDEFAQDPDRVRPHHEFADGPAECLRLHGQDFKAVMHEAFLPVRDYSRWLMTADMTSAYEYQKLALQILQSQARGPWSLKMPSHALHIEWLMKTFPDARVVWIHRDPYKTLASLFSMKSAKWHYYCGNAAVDWLTEHYIWQLSEHVNRPRRLRQRRGSQQFYDLFYCDLMRDPIAELRKLYAWAGDDLSPQAEGRMQHWLEARPFGRFGFGRHEYTLDQFGLAPRDLERHFGEYLAEYAPEPEGC